MVLDLEKEQPQARPASAVALGFFDGVHIGHQAILARTASLPGLYPLACTFLCHPGKNRALLMNNPYKEEVLRQLGMKEVVFLHFDQIHTLSPEAFVRDILINRLQAKALVCGYNYHFGHGASGNSETLQALCGKYQLALHILPKVELAAQPVSSSRIRTLIEAGNLKDAFTLLGRPFSVCEKVVYGKQLGRTIGIPTINQFPAERFVLPARGVYASRTLVDDVFYPSITNVGVRPTVDEDDTVNFETHIIGIHQNLYGRYIRVDFYDRIRGEEKFATVAALKDQIMADILASEVVFRAYPPEKG